MLLFIPFILLLFSKQIHTFENVQPVQEEMEDKFIQNRADVFVNSSINLIANGPRITTSPAPPLVERIEIRLVDAENTTEETPLIIVDVVKKNNGSGVAATIQQHHGENLELNKPNQGFLVRLKQPNYHSVSYIPYGRTEKMPKMNTTEATMETEETGNIPADESMLLPKTTTTMPDSLDEMDENVLNEEGEKIIVNDSELALATTTAESAGLGEMVQIVPIGQIEGQNQKKLESIEKEDNKMKIGEIDEENMKEINIEEEENDEELPKNLKNIQNEKEEKIADNEDDEEEKRTEALMNLENTKMFNESEFSSLNGGNDGTNLSTALEFGYDLRGKNEVEEIVGGEEGINNENAEKTNEECLANRENLREVVIKRLIAERRRIVQAIKKINKHQMLLCRPNQEQNQVPYRKCPMWRREKFFLYYALMRITYCGNHARWPGGRRFRAV